MIKNNEDMKICLNRLLEKRVISEEDNQSNFQLIKKYATDIQKICSNNLGLRFILTAHFAKIEKNPYHPDPFMGMDKFSDTGDYVMFACAMSFVEENGLESPFILPELTKYLKLKVPNGLEWKQYHIRKRLVRILHQMISLKIITILDGEFDDFDRNENQVALFKATTYSRYFLNMFSENLQTLSNWNQLVPVAKTEDIGKQVIQRLFLSPGICRTEKTEPLFNYMRNNQNYLTEFFEANSFYDFELSKNLGMLISSIRKNGTKYIPDNGSDGDILMLIGSKFRSLNFIPDEYGQLHINYTQWQSIVSEIVQKNKEVLSKAFREKSFETLSRELLEENIYDGLIIQSEDSLIITPIIARLNGKFTLDD